MIAGLCVTLFMSGAHNDIYDIFHEKEARYRNAVKTLSLATPGVMPASEEIAKKARLKIDELAVIASHPNAQAPLFSPSWLPTIAFTWRIMVGTLTTVLVALCFSRKRETLVALQQ